MWAIWNSKHNRWLVAERETFVRCFLSEAAATNWKNQMAMPPEYVVRSLVEVITATVTTSDKE